MKIFKGSRPFIIKAPNHKPRIREKYTSRKTRAIMIAIIGGKIDSHKGIS